MRSTSPLTQRLGLLGTVAAVVLAPQISPAAGSTPAASDIALNVATELDRLGGPRAALDTSTGPAVDCIFGADPEPLTYSTREIVLRTSLPEAVARTRVMTAIANAQSPGSVGTAETIQLPTVPPLAGERESAEELFLTPIVVVNLLPEGESEVEIVEVARELRSLGVKASPNYLMAPQRDGPVGILPNGYPRRTLTVTPERNAAYGDDVDVFVYDVGAPPTNQSDRPPNLSLLDSALDREVLDTVAPIGKVDRYWAGHTNAIADIFQTLAPAAKVTAVRVTDSRRILTDVSATRRMASTLQAATDPPEVIVNSFGAAACDQEDPADGEMVPLGLEGISEAIDRRGDSVVVASAGNNGTDRRFYPAAFETDPVDDVVLAVGALDVVSATDPVNAPLDGMWISPTRSGPPSEFSNFGTWLDVWAPGEGLPVRHIDGLRFLKKLPVLLGRGTVAGTSYAAPAAGALIAEQISRTGESPLKAWQSIQEAGAPCDDTLGGVAVALTTMADFADREATGASECVPN